MIEQTTIKFLKDLNKNNNKEWFEKNRKHYENAKQNFIDVTQEVIKGLGKIDASIAHLEARKSIFRINRDVRFSKDKSPYKTNMGMFLSRTGKSSIHAGYYFHLEPDKCFIGGGLYMPMPDVLAKVRQEIDYNWNEFNNIITNKKFVAHFKILNKSKEFSLTRPPKGYDDTNLAIEYLKLKSWIAGINLKNEELTNKNISKKIATSFEALKPLLDFLNKAIES